MDATVRDGIVVGAAGGAIAGFMLWFAEYLHKKTVDAIDKRSVYRWLKANTSNEAGHQYRSTRAIASWTNLTEDRVRFICSVHPKIYLSTGPKEDLWSLHERGDRSVYEDRGLLEV